MRIEAPRAYWQDWKPDPQLKPEQGDILIRVSLPYSDIHWLNQVKFADAAEALKSGKIKPYQYLSERGTTTDDNGNELPGNITGEIYWAIYANLPLSRLNYIGQLGLLFHSTKDQIYEFSKGTDFSHTRLSHSLTTAKVGEGMAICLGLPEQEKNQLVVAALMHDIAMPPFGDATIELDAEALSEEVAISRLLRRYDLKALERFGVQKRQILATIRGQGILGKLLDLADKISYTACDVDHYIGDPYTIDISNVLDVLTEPIAALVRADPNWADLYKDIRLTSTGKPYFNNIQRLSIFLELRAKMHDALYLNPRCRGLDLLYRLLLAPLYSRHPQPTKPLNSRNLLYLTDDELARIVSQAWGLSHDIHHISHTLDVAPNYAQVDDETEIDHMDEQLRNRGEFVLAAEEIRSFNTGTDIPVLNQQTGKAQPYFQVQPEHASYLEQIAQGCHKFVVYYWPNLLDAEFSNEAKLRPIFEKIIGDLRQHSKGKIPLFR